VVVMYAGKIVESAPVALFADPQHPTRSACWARSRASMSTARGFRPSRARCRAIASPRAAASRTLPVLRQALRPEPPPLRDIGPGHRVACWKPRGMEGVRI